MQHIMIVEDSDLDRMMIEDLLKPRGYICLPAEDGSQALERLKDWSVDLILTDLKMPKMDGLQLVKAIRREDHSVPIILMTGEGSEDIAAEAPFLS